MLKPLPSRSILALSAAAFVVLATSDGFANDINKGQGLDARSQSKIAREIAKSRVQGRTISPRQTVSECGSVEVGNVDTGDRRNRRGQAPREVVVVTGDIIAFGGNCN